MRVVVTGGSGILGSAVCSLLIDQGVDLLSVDITPSQPPSLPFRRVDILDLGQVIGALEGADAVIHCAGIPRPTFDPPERVFQTNVQGTFHVFEAARLAAVRRIVYVSSIAVLGFPFFTMTPSVKQFPVDETLPSQAQDPYGLSKLIGEDIAAGYAQRGVVDAVSLRLPWIHSPQSFHDTILPLHAHDPRGEGPANLWAYIDSRDAARACCLAAQVPVSGHEIVFAAASDTFMPVPTHDLIAAHYSNTPVDPTLTGFASTIAIDKAKRLLGFNPRYTWRGFDGANH